MLTLRLSIFAFEFVPLKLMSNQPLGPWSQSASVRSANMLPVLLIATLEFCSQVPQAFLFIDVKN